MKQERFNAKSDTGEFKKERAGPKGSAKTGGKNVSPKEKHVSEENKEIYQKMNFISGSWYG